MGITARPCLLRALAAPVTRAAPCEFSPAGHLLEGSRRVSKTGGAGTFITIDPDLDMFTIVLTNHGLPLYSTFGVDSSGYVWTGFDEMLDEIRPDLVNNYATAAVLSGGSFSM